MSQARYTVATLAAGQRRPYADAVYHYRVTIEWQGMAGYRDKEAPFIPWPELARPLVEQRLRGLCGGWPDAPGAFDRRLKSLTQTAPGVWDVVIVEPYDD